MQSTLLAAFATGLLMGAGSVAIGLRALKRGRTSTAQPRIDTAECNLHRTGRFDDLEHVIDSAGIGMYFWDMRSDTITWSTHHFTIFGWPPGQAATYAMFRERIHPEDLARVDDAVAAALRDHTDYHMRYRLLLPDGTVRHVNGSGRAVYDQQGNPISMNGAVIDVTQAILAENVTRQRESELVLMAENLPDIISRFDNKCRFLFMSPRIENVTGKPAAFYVGKTHAEIGIDPVLALRWRAVLESVIRGKCAREFDFSFIDQHGHELFFITRAVPSFDSHGDVETVLSFTTDYTERERDAETVRAAGAMLKKTDERKNQYLATLAHELRGPLAPISSATQLIKLSAQRVVREKAREVIERQVAALSGLVNDLMQVERINAGKLEIDKSTITIQTVIAQAVEIVRPLFDAKHQPLALHVPDGPIWLEGDLPRLTQVFGNLLTNASKYSPEGAPVSISAALDGHDVAVHVRDGGIGLSTSDIDDVFDIFVQVHATGVQSQGGLGIGLSLVKQLVELHEGKVTVASEGVGKGSCFTVRLPLREGQSQPETRAPATLSALRPLSVLVVDDNIDGATTLALLLETLGHRAMTAHTGQDAVQLAAEHPVDMAFVDLGLPDISGVQVALRIRGTQKGRKLPLYALTGLGRDEDRFLTQAAQFNEHIVKPLHMDDLLRITAAVAKQQAVATANAGEV